MDMLWAPEIGRCGSCSCDGCVRKYVCDGKVHVYCFACWNGNQSEQGGQVGYVMSSRDWGEDETLVFRYPGSVHGTPQRVIFD